MTHPTTPTLPPLPGFTVLGLSPDPIKKERERRAAKRLAGDAPPDGLFGDHTINLIDRIREEERK